MSKILSVILPIAGSIIGGIIGGPLGAAIGGALGGLAASGVNALLAPKAAKPETTETSIKTPIPPRVDAVGGPLRLYGASILYETAGDGTTVDVWAFKDGRAANIIAVYLNDKKVTLAGNVVQALADKTYQGGNVKAGYSLGQTPGTAFADVIAKLPGIWTTNHRGDGVVTGYLLKNPEKEKYYLETYPQGDNVQMSLVGQWTPVFDPRDPTQNPYDETTWKWSDNAALTFIWYMMVRRGYDWNARFEPQRARTIAAINDCDIAQALAAGSTERRYRTAATWKRTETPANIIATLLSAFDGWFILNSRNEVVLYSGRYYEPTITLGPDDIASYSLQHNTAIEDRLNEITINYVSSLHDYNTVDAQSWRDEDAIEASGQEPNTTDLGAQIPSFTQGRRLAKRKMSRANAPNRGTISTKFSGRRALGERYVHLQLIEAGSILFDGPVEIVSPPELDMNTGGVTFEWVAADPNIDAWNPATEDGQGAPVGNRFAPEPLAAPTIASATPIYDASTDGGTGVRVQVVAEAPTGLMNLTWFMRWRKDASSVWVERQYDDVGSGSEATILSDFLTLSDQTQIEVEYRSPDGRLSGYSDPAMVNTKTDTTPPDNATSISLDSWANAIALSTSQIPRASSYQWSFYASDGTTLIRTIVTNTQTVQYSAGQAASDGVRRSYVVKVRGVNSAGAGGAASSDVINKLAPGAVGSPAIAGGSTTATATCSAQTGDIGGYVVFYSTASGFDPSTTGGVVTSGSPSIPIYGLAAGTYYGRIAAYDTWTANPAQLNLSAEKSFTITTGGGSTPSGGGTDGGGYHGSGGRNGTQIP